MATRPRSGPKSRRSPRKAPFAFLLLVYRMPSSPTAGRVAVWRLLKKAGTIYVQQSCCVFPNTPDVRAELAPTLDRITASGGQYHLLPLGSLSADEEAKLISEFVEQTGQHYQEIIENCEVNFQKEIEFETFRNNFTYAEAEEIRSEYEKICQWFDRVKARDWFDAPNRAEAASWLRRCSQMLAQFESRVFKEQALASDKGPKARTKRAMVRRTRAAPTALPRRSPMSIETRLNAG